MTESLTKQTTMWTNPKETHYWKELDILKGGHGCPLACIYCNQQELDFDPDSNEKTNGYFQEGIDGGVSINSRLMIGRRVIQEISTDALISELKTYPYYTPNSSLLIQNFTDPGLNWQESIQIGKRIVGEFDHQGALIYITKAGIGSRGLAEFVDLKEKGGKPIVIVTYSGLPKEIEPASGEHRIETIKKLHETGIPVVLSMRPMIKNINVDETNIRRIAQEVAMYVDAVTVGGLYVYNFTAEEFARAGYPLDDIYSHNKYPVAKVLPEDIRPTVRRIMAEEGVKAVIHDHTSCAVAQILTTVYETQKTDRLAHWAGQDATTFDYCSTYCDNRQVKVCQSTSQAEKKAIIQKAESALKRLGFSNKITTSDTQTGLLLVIDGALPIDVLFHLYEATGWTVNNWPNYETVMSLSREVVQKKMKQPPGKVLGAVPVGQEWSVIVDGDLDGQNNELTAKWIRSQNRARIQVIDINELGNLSD